MMINIAQRSRHRLLYGLALLVLLGMITSCDIVEQAEATPIADASVPTVEIVSPIDAAVILVNQEVAIQSDARDQLAITRVELLINDEVVRVDANADPQPQTPFIVAQPWTPDAVGTYTIQSRAYNTANVAGASAIIRLNVVETIVTPTSEIVEPLATATLTQTQAPILTPTASPSPPPAGTPTITPIPTQTATPEPTPVLLPTATFAPTGLLPEGRFEEIWLSIGGAQSHLGFPIQAQLTGRDYAKQAFSGGLMIWWNNPNGRGLIWVLEYGEGTFQAGVRWRVFEDRWSGSEYSCDAARTNGGPIRGFGKVWCDNIDVATHLGAPVEPEAGSGGNTPFSQVQFFQGGLLVYTPLSSEVFILFNQGNWQKVIY